MDDISAHMTAEEKHQSRLLYSELVDVLEQYVDLNLMVALTACMQLPASFIATYEKAYDAHFDNNAMACLFLDLLNKARREHDRQPH